MRPFRFCEWGMAARPIGGHKNLWNGKMAATEPFSNFAIENRRTVQWHREHVAADLALA